MGWMPPPDGIEMCHAGDVALPATEEKASMEKARIIGIDLAKRVFPGAWGDAGRPAGVSQESVTGAVSRLPG